MTDVQTAAAVVAAGLDSRDADEGPLHAVLRELKIPAVSVAVVQDGRVAAARAWGTRDVEGTEPATVETRFQAGSVSKPVAATGVLRLVADGVLDLDEDVDQRLQRWHVPPMGDWQPTLTLRLLLSHTAGTTVHGFPGYTREEQVPDAVAVLRGSGNTAAVKVDQLPGIRWRYSGGGTTVVQVLLEDVTGRPFAELLHDLVLEPSGMTTASFAQPPPAELHHLLAQGATDAGKPVPGGWHVYPETAAAGLWCTPTDLARWVLAVQESLDRGGLLPRDLAREMVREHAPGWGLGPHVSRCGEHPRFGHGGADEGFLTMVEAGQHDATGIVIMASSDAAGPLMVSIAAAVASARGWPLFPAPPTGDLETLLAPYVGRWRTAAGLELRVESTGQGLVLHLPGQRPLPLSPTSLSLWGAAEVEVEFAPAHPGEPTSLTIRPAAAFTATRVGPD